MSTRSIFRSMRRIGLSIWISLIGLFLVRWFIAAPIAVQAQPESPPIPRTPLIVNSSVFTVGVAPCSTSSIQACINNTSVVTGDTIYIPAGTYVESLSIDTNNPVVPKWVSLIGADANTTIVRAANGQRVLALQGAAITSAMVISGLTFAGGDLSGVAGDCVLGPDGSCGAGILLWDQAQPLIQHVIISGNRATYGGGLYAAGGIHVTLANAKIVSNSASYGGGVFVFGDANTVAEVLTLTNTEFISNTATSTPSSDGGGAQVGDILDPNTGTKTKGGVGLTGGKFVGNRASRYGGALYVYAGPLTVSGAELLDNRATGVNGRGGGIYVDSGAATLLNTVFERNSAGYGGGGAYIVPAAGTALSLDGGRFVSNQGPNGGGLTLYGNVIMTGAEFLSNTASLGGGIYEGGGRLTFAGGRFENNYASGGLGGGVYGVSSSGGHVLSGTQFLSNTARSQGGGMHLRGSLQLIGVQFTNNAVTGASSRGGGLYADDGNSAQNLFLTSTQFINNSATSTGGGAYFNGHYWTDVHLVNSLFARNQAGEAGAALATNVDTAAANLRVSLLHATIADVNLNPKPAMAVLSGTLHVTNTIVASHSIGISQTIGAVYEDYNLYFNVPLTVTGLVTSGGHSRTGDPQFLNSIHDDYHIGSGSAALDAGFNMGVLADFEGDWRDDLPDIGYDEAALIPITGLSATNSSPTQLGQVTTLTASITTGAGVAYAWNFGDGQTGSGRIVTHIYPSIGAYTAIVTASNSVSVLTATTRVTVTDAPVGGLGAVNNSPTQLGGVTTLTATISAGTNVAYAWNFGDGQTSSGRIVTHTYPSVGAYTALVTASNSVSVLTAATRVTVTDAPVSGLGAVNNSPTQLGGVTTLTATISAGTNVTYAWSFGDGQVGSGPVVNHVYPTVAAHIAIVTASNNVSVVTATTRITITDVPIAGLSATNNSPTPLGGITTLTASVTAGTNIIYTWTLGDGQVRSGRVVTHVYPSVGVYTAIVTAANAVSVLTAATGVTITDVPIAGLSATHDSPTLLGHPTTLTANVAQGTHVAYQWSLGDGTLGSGQVVTHVYPHTGLFTAVVTATNSASGPIVAATVITITSEEIPISGLIATNSSPTPLGSVTMLTASVAAGSTVVYAWNFGDGQIGSGRLATHLYPSVGIYTAVVTASNSVSTVITETVAVVTDAPIVGLSSTNSSPTALGHPTLLTVTTAGGSGITYAWNFGDGTLPALGSLVTHTYAARGFYTAIATASNSLGSVTAATAVTITDVPVGGLIAMNDGPTLLGNLTVLTAHIATGTNVAYTWNLGDGQVGSGPVITHIYPHAGAFTASVTASNTANVVTATTVVTIVTAEIPISGLTATNDSPTLWGAFTTFTASVSAGSTVAYTWDFGGGHLGSGRVVTHVCPLGAHTVVVTASNSISALTTTTVVSVIASHQIYLPLTLKNSGQ